MAAGAFAEVSAVAPRARAQATAGDGFTLEWTAPESCPDRASVTGAVRELLRGRSEPSPRTTLHARASIERDGAGWTLRVRTGDEPPDRERVVNGADCAELADAAAVIVALAVDPALQDRPPPPAPLPETAEPASSPARPSDTHASSDAAAGTTMPSSSAPVVVSLAAYGALDAAALPSPAPGASLELGASIGRFGLAAYGAWLPSQHGTVEGGSTGGDVSLLLGGGLLRYRLLRAPLELDAALAFEVGSLHGEAPDALTPSEGRALWLAPGAGLRAGYPISPHWLVQLGATALFPVSRERFVVTGVGEVHRPPVATVRGTLGIEARFW